MAGIEAKTMTTMNGINLNPALPFYWEAIELRQPIHGG